MPVPRTLDPFLYVVLVRGGERRVYHINRSSSPLTWPFTIDRGNGVTPSQGVIKQSRARELRASLESEIERLKAEGWMEMSRNS